MSQENSHPWPLLPSREDTIPPALESLARRVGHAYVRRRLNAQAVHTADVLGTFWRSFHIEDIFWAHYLIRKVLAWTGTAGRGHRNAMHMHIRERDVRLRHLPRAFDGFRLLHMSDFHFDFNPSRTDVIGRAVEGLEYDACVLSGDYRARTLGTMTHAAEEMDRFVKRLRKPVYAVLGNHDHIEIVPSMERAGVRVLLNESEVIERGGGRLAIVGVDDPHLYGSDLDRACEGVPDDAVSVLLAHTPELWREAAMEEVDLYLCGHTHGGQICLPGGGIVFSNTRCPRRFLRGAWRFRDLQGYTTTGVGVSGVDARFFCPAELVVHVLRRA